MIAVELMAIRDPVVTSYTRGDPPWFVQFYDPITERFYSGSGSDAWTAIAWAFDEYITRGIMGITRTARNAGERPGDFIRACELNDKIAAEWTVKTGPTVWIHNGEAVDAGAFDETLAPGPSFEALEHVVANTPEIQRAISERVELVAPSKPPESASFETHIERTATPTLFGEIPPPPAKKKRGKKAKGT